MNIRESNINSKYIPIIEEGIREIQSHYDIIGILLFGSLANNTEKSFQDAMSDVDLIILVKELPSMRERLQFLRTLTIDPRLSIFFLTPKEVQGMMTSADWMMDALYSGKILYDPQSIFRDLIALFHKKLQEKQITQTPLYWVRKVPFGDEVEL